ncbi:MAG: peptidyl-prolyl cis-trans isomerase, partial [Gammaproteobacteria bacterium]|nr:peptidyl-prolyl cis-trans isomerase [Gammaproteobacteria bacterium]
MKYFTGIFLLLLTACVQGATNNPLVRLETNQGNIILELHYREAPETVENFVRYADEGFYEGILFHRVMKGYLIQGGAYTEVYE